MPVGRRGREEESEEEEGAREEIEAAEEKPGNLGWGARKEVGK